MAGIFDAITTENPEYLQSSAENAKRAEVAAAEAKDAHSQAHADADLAKHYMEVAAGVVTGVAFFNERTGGVYPQAGDYTAAMVGAKPADWYPTWNDVTGKPSMVTLDTTQTLTGYKILNATETISGNSGFGFGYNNSAVTVNPNTGDVEIIHGASRAILGLQDDGVIFAKTNTGSKLRYYTEANPFPLATTYKISTPASAATQNLNAKNASVFSFTLTSATTNVRMSAYSDVEAQARQVTIILKQDVFGARKVNWDSKIKWSQGRIPVLSLDANVTDIVTLLTTDSGATWYGFYQGGWF